MEKISDEELIELEIEKVYTIDSENSTGLYCVHRIDYNQFNL